VWLKHVLRHESLLHDIIEGREKGKITGGQKRMHILSDLTNNKFYFHFVSFQIGNKGPNGH